MLHRDVIKYTYIHIHNDNPVRNLYAVIFQEIHVDDLSLTHVNNDSQPSSPGCEVV